MPETKAPWAGVQPVSKNPELDNLRDRETALVGELDRLKKMNPNKVGGDHDLQSVIHRAEGNLTEIKKAILEATK